jgi:hypothetical protein
MTTKSYLTTHLETGQVYPFKVSIEPLYPNADKVLRFYTVRSPSGFREVEFHCNRAAIAPLLKCGWTVISVREVDCE